MKALLLVAAAVMFASSVWGAACYFKTQDMGAVVGRRTISLLGGVSILVSIWNIYFYASGAPVRSIAALLMIGSGSLLFWTTLYVCRYRDMSFAFATTPPDFLVLTGPYRIVRHPFYSSYILGWLGCLLAAPTVISLSIAGCMAAVYWLASRREEAVILGSHWGTAYTLYARNTGRFVPRIDLAARWLRPRAVDER